jgi:hypothetical protein
MAINRELSQFGRLVEISDGEHIGIGTTSNVSVGFGTVTVNRINGLVLPTSSGSAGNVLKTDGSGNLTFEPVGAGGTWAVTGVGIHTTKNVGVGTTNPTSKFTVSGNSIITGVSTLGNTIVGGATTQLIVNGSARITGILTIGTSSVTLDGTNNQVNVGTGVTLHHTNGVQVGSNTLHSSGLTLNSLSVGNVNSSGIITASSFVGPVTGISTGLSSGTSSVSIASTNGSIKFIVNNSLVATLSTAGIFSFVDLDMGLNNINNLAEPAAASDAATKNYADTGTSTFPTGDYGGFTSGDTDAFGQVTSNFTSYDLLDEPSGSIQTEDFGVLT